VYPRIERRVSFIDQLDSLEREKLLMKNPAMFFGGIALAIIGIALGVFFLVPNIPHIIADTHMHIKHATAAFALGVLGIILALISRPKAA
jgi:hypothetical protein